MHRSMMVSRRLLGCFDRDEWGGGLGACCVKRAVIFPGAVLHPGGGLRAGLDWEEVMCSGLVVAERMNRPGFHAVFF